MTPGPLGPLAELAEPAGVVSGDALLDVRNLQVSFPTSDSVVRAVRGASFQLRAGQTLGVVGESGSGKSVCTQALVGLLPGADIAGEAYFDGRDLLAMSHAALREIRGHRIGMVFQDPLTSLHPLYRIGWQLVEAIRAHQRVSRTVARARAIELLELVGIPHPSHRVDDYPHQFSGGMRQRVLIAMALALQPQILIADEPTTALDATVQAQILELLVTLQKDLGTALILITHDLGVVADLADRVMVMYAGRPVEMAGRRDTYYHPHHPYTRGLLESIPVAGDRTRLAPIPGQPPSMLVIPAGCPFRVRCRYAFDRCAHDDPPLRRIGADRGHLSACWLPDSVAGEVDRRVPPKVVAPAAGDEECAENPDRAAKDRDGQVAPLLVVDDVVKYFPVRSSALNRHGAATVHAVDHVSLRVTAGETLGLVGETGCGKSTLARCVARLYPLTSGRISFAGSDVTALDKSALREFRRDVQVVFQDPYGSLNPRRRVGSIIGEPLRVHGLAAGRQRRAAVQELMSVVGLNPEHYNRYPAEFSGGQRQRIGIARALAVRPKLIVCDEPVSALDVSVRAQVINLLSDLQDEFSLTCVFISHDLSVVEHVSDRVAVMYLGQVVEIASADALYATPHHPYTAALLSAAPTPDPDRAQARERIVVEGDVPSPITPPSGCRFHPRCPRAQQRCTVEAPQLRAAVEGEQHHLTACHFPIRAGERT